MFSAIAQLTGATRLTYLLRTLFSSVTGQPVVLSNGTVLNPEDDNEGMLDGTLTIVDTSTGDVQINNDALQLNGSNAYGTTGAYSNGIPRLDGIYVEGKLTPKSGSQLCGLHFNSAQSVAIVTGYGVSVSGSTLYVLNNSTHINTGLSLTIGVTYDVRVVLRSPLGFIAYIKGGSEFSDWAAILVSAFNASATMYVALFEYYAAASSLASGIKVPEQYNPVEYSWLDNFEEASPPVLITDHTPDVGAGYSVLTGFGAASITGAGILGNTALATWQGGMYDIGVKSCSLHYVRNWAATPPAGTNSNILHYVKYVDDDNYLFAQESTNGNTFSLTERVNGVTNPRGSVGPYPTIAGNTDYPAMVFYDELTNDWGVIYSKPGGGWGSLLANFDAALNAFTQAIADSTVMAFRMYSESVNVSMKSFALVERNPANLG